MNRKTAAENAEADCFRHEQRRPEELGRWRWTVEQSPRILQYLKVCRPLEAT